MAYDFMTLSPEDFESLVADLLSADWGAPLESFKSGKDGGIDLRHSRSLRGGRTTIVQCKRYAPHKFAELVRSSENEVVKLERLRPKRYVLVTSVKLSPGNKKSLVDALSPWCKSSRDIYGPNELNTLLRLHPEIEQAHFKLWISSTAVLDRVLNARIFSVTEATIESTKLMLSKLVVHEGFSRAIQLLEEHNHVMIVGNPGIGKSTLAKMLMCHFMRDHFDPVWIVSDIEDAWSLIHKARDTDKKIVLVYDDFLGRLQYNSLKFGKNEEHSLMELLDTVSRHCNMKLVLTTREYIFADAQRMHGAFESRSAEILKYTLALSVYTPQHRAEMLFNHLYFSDLPDTRLAKLLESKAYRTIVEHQHFNPRIVEGISKRANSDALSDEQYLTFIQEEFDNPVKLWRHPFRNEISALARKTLFALWSFGGPADLNNLSKCVADLSPTCTAEDFSHEFQDAMHQLDGNFLRTNRYPAFDFSSKNFIVVEFENPSIEEFIGQLLTSEQIWMTALAKVAKSLTQISQLSDHARKSGIKGGIQAEFWNTLRINAKSDLHLEKCYLTNVLSEGTSSTYKAWVRTTHSQPNFLREILAIEQSGGYVDLVHLELKQRVLTSQNWIQLLRSLRYSELDGYSIYSLQSWIAQKSDWSVEDIERSQAGLREALCNCIESRLELTVTGIISIVEACNFVERKWSASEISHIVRAVSTAVASAISETKTARQADDLLQYANDLDELKKITSIDIEDLCSELMDKYEQFHVVEPARSRQPQQPIQTRDNGKVFDIDKLFNGLLDR